MKIAFSARSWEQYLHWQGDAETLARLNNLIRECIRSPFVGLGKPEPLKGDYKGWWSRRITLNDRIIYRVSGKPPDQTLEILQCRFHYDQ